jgi:hypothetical protein
MSTENASPVCPVCGARSRWVDDAWVCTRRSCGAEWYPDPTDVRRFGRHIGPAREPAFSVVAGCVVNAARLSVGVRSAVSSVCLVPGSRVSYTTQTGEPQEAS